MAWKLNKVGDVECTMDDSGIYTIINRVEEKGTHKQYAGNRISVRVDIMAGSQKYAGEIPDEPLQSFIGTGDNVRKHVIGWIVENNIKISLEHVSYIGAEVQRAEHESHFVQR